MKYLLIPFLAFSSILFSSCEGNTDVFVEVVNNSSEVIILDAGSSGGFIYSQGLEIGVGESGQIGSWSQCGGNASSFDITTSIITLSAKQKVNNKKLDSAVYQDSSRWENEVEEIKKVPADYKHKYSLTLVDGDFQ